MALHLHRAERTDLLADGLADLLADPLRRPVRARGGRGPTRRGSSAGSHSGCPTGSAPAGDGRRRSLRRCAVPQPALAGLDAARPRPRRPVGARPARVAAARGDRRLARRAVGGDAGGSTSATGRRATRPSCAGTVAGRSRAEWPGSSRRTPDSGRRWSPTGGRAATPTGRAATLAADLRWQPELWRRLVAAVGTPPPDERHAETWRACDRGGDGLDLPGRLSLFGHTRLPLTEVQLLAALGRAAATYTCGCRSPRPRCGRTWPRPGPGTRTPPRRRPSARGVGHPLLASLGRDARELQRALAGVGVDHDHAAVAVRRRRPPCSAPPVRPPRQPRSRHRPSAPAGCSAPDDRSVQVHACHGPHRQVDVLREVLVGLLQDRPDLEPRDILVMCPDVETYAPLIEAGFGLGEVVADAHPAHGCGSGSPTERSVPPTRCSPLAARLVELAGGRVTATEVLDLAGPRRRTPSLPTSRTTT